MLERRDLQAIAALLDEKLNDGFAKLEEKLEAKWNKQLDERFAEFEERLEAKWNKQLDERFTAFEEKLDKKLDVRFAGSERKMDEKINSVAEMLLKELALTQNYLERRIDRLDTKIEEIDQYYRIRRLDDDSIGMILKIIEELSGRVDKLEAGAVH